MNFRHFKAFFNGFKKIMIKLLRKHFAYLYNDLKITHMFRSFYRYETCEYVFKKMKNPFKVISKHYLFEMI